MVGGVPEPLLGRGPVRARRPSRPPSCQDTTIGAGTLGIRPSVRPAIIGGGPGRPPRWRGSVPASPLQSRSSPHQVTAPVPVPPRSGSPARSSARSGSVHTDLISALLPFPSGIRRVAVEPEVAAPRWRWRRSRCATRCPCPSPSWRTCSNSAPNSSNSAGRTNAFARRTNASDANSTQARTDLDQAQRQSKRQAAPFSKGPPKPQPKTPGRKSGAAHGRHGHRLPPARTVDEVLEAPLPDACPHCGGPVRETEVATQYQTEIPRRPLIRQFNVHVGCCCGCGRRVQGRHPLQTSDALGAAASQIGPDAQAAVATAEQDLRPVARQGRRRSSRPSSASRLTRGASAEIVLRAADRLGPAHQEIREEIKAPRRA